MKKFNEKTLGLLLVAGGLAALLVGLRSPGNSPDRAVSQLPFSQGVVQPSKGQDATRTECQVLTVYDGDTLGCDLDGDGRIQRPQEEIRLLGVDSPEMHYSKKNASYRSANPVDEPFAKAASQWMSQRTLHKTVYLEFDQRRSDRYRRTLAFVYSEPRGAVSLNEQSVAAGLATMLFIGKNHLHEERFLQVEAEARTAKRGLWASSEL